MAVISEQLAAELFMSVDAAGYEITLFDATYVVVGVYKQPESLVSLLGSDGSETLYVPFTSHRDMGNLPVNTISIFDSELGEEGFRQNHIEDLLKKDMGVHAEAYRVIDYYRSSTMVSQWLGLFGFLVALWMVCLLLGSAGRLLGEMKDFVIVGLKQDYFNGFLKKRFMTILFFMGRILGVIALSVFLLVYARPQVFIPAEYIPPDNIFDFSFYLGKAREALAASNAMAGYISTPVEHAFQTSATFGFIMLLLLIPAFLSLVSALRLIKHMGYPVRHHLFIFGLSFALSLIILLLISATGLIGLSLSMRGIIILSMFYWICVLRKGKDHLVWDGSFYFILVCFWDNGGQ